MQESSSKIIKLHWSWIVPILLLAFALAMPHIQSHALWFDEAYTHSYTGSGRLSELNMPVWGTVVSIARHNPSWPPLYFVLQNIWSQFAGNTQTSEHMLPLLAGVLTIAVVYRFGTALFGEKGGILTALLVSTSAFYIHFMHETRAYTLFTLFISLSGWFYWMLINRKNIQRGWIRAGFSLFIALALYTHYVAGAFTLGIAVYHILVQYPLRDKKLSLTTERWWLISRLWFNGCLLFSPWVAVLIVHITHEKGSDRALPFSSLMQSAAYGFSNNLWIILVPIMLFSIVFWKKREVSFLWIWSIVSIIVIAIVNAFASFLFHPRHILPLLLIFILMLIPGLLEIDKRIKGLSTIVIGLYAGAGIFFSFNPTFMTQIPTSVPLIPLVSILEMEDAIEQCVGEDDAVIYSFSDPGIEVMQFVMIQYYDLKDVQQYSQLGELTAIVSDDDKSWQLLDDVSANSKIMDFASGHDTIWFMGLPDLQNQSNIMLLDTVLTGENYRRCPVLERGENAAIWSYTQSENTCKASC